MRILLLVLTIAMIAKDAVPLGDPYILRGVTQSLALLAGAAATFLGFQGKYLVRNWLVFLYLLLLVLSLTYSSVMQYSALQVLSLLGPILFFAGVNRGSNANMQRNNNLVINTTLVLYTLVCVISLAIWMVNPASMQENLWGEIRFTGLFNKAGMMGTAAGLLLGIALLKRFLLPLRIISALAALACLYLTLSRTFIIAALLGYALTTWLYYPKRRKFIAIGAALVVAAAVAFQSAHYLDAQDEKQIDKVVRSESLGSLSGRTDMWKSVLDARLESGLTGEGFAAGGLLLMKKESHALLDVQVMADPRAIGRTTLHSGYIQALADLGWIGLAVYIANIAMAILLVLFKDRSRQFPLEFYLLIFLAVSNSAESIIYTASNFPTVLFWYLCIFANNLNRTVPSVIPRRVAAAPMRVQRYGT